MANNKLTDLNNHLFAQLERLGEEDLKGDKLKDEISRAKAISSVAKDIITNAKTALEGVQFAYKYSNIANEIPEQFKPKALTQN